MTFWVPAFSPAGTSPAFVCMVTNNANDPFVLADQAHKHLPRTVRSPPAWKIGDHQK
jgi:hypothetical protein